LRTELTRSEGQEIIRSGVVLEATMQTAHELFDLDHPTCICGLEMRLKMIVPIAMAPHETQRCENHIFECALCQHELRVMHDLPRTAAYFSPAGTDA
jgi:hypothetical protein